MEEEEGGEENFVGEDDEVCEEDGVEDGEKDEEEGTDEDSTQQVNAEDVILHFIDCIVQGEQKADRNVVLSCLESALHALRQWFPHVSKIIVQSDNATNLTGKQLSCS